MKKISIVGLEGQHLQTELCANVGMEGSDEVKNLGLVAHGEGLCVMYVIVKKHEVIFVSRKTQLR